MRRVFKWKIPLQDVVEVQLPEGTQILKVEPQGLDKNVQLWGLCDPEMKNEKRKLRIAGTGHPINEKNLKHINTFQMVEGQLVFHVFEVME
jgi:hypothetical protein